MYTHRLQVHRKRNKLKKIEIRSLTPSLGSGSGETSSNQSALELVLQLPILSRLERLRSGFSVNAADILSFF